MLHILSVVHNDLATDGHTSLHWSAWSEWQWPVDEIMKLLPPQVTWQFEFCCVTRHWTVDLVVYLLSPLSAEPACVIDHRHRHVISEPFLVAAKSNLWTKSESLRRLMIASVNERPVHRLDFFFQIVYFIAALTLI